MNRRSFIQKAGLLTSTLFVSIHSLSAYSLLNIDNKIKGKVTSRGRGIANVVISDGYEVVQTNSNGHYELEINALAKFIWVSTPSGYEFTTDSYLAKYYEPLNTKTSLNFKLKALSQDDSLHSFIIWADPQVKNKTDVEKMFATSVPDTIQTIKSLGDAPIHGITVGDIVWDNHELFADYNRAVREMGIPFFQCLGNHDMDYRMGGDETSDKTFQEHYGPTYYSFNRGKAHYIVLDDVRYLGEERKYDGFINEKQLNWLEKDLKFVAKDALVIINLHIPVHNSVKNNQAFYAVLQGFSNVHIMSGHTHYTRNVITNGIFEHNHGAVCGAWWTGPVCEDGTPRGYGVYQVDGTNLKWFYQPTGLNRKEQVHIYVDELTNQKRLIANVWNWDPMWKVEYFLDGVAMGALENQKGYDPQTVSLYKGKTLPAGRTFPEPHSTEHLFVAHFPPTVKVLKVVATDRFGEQFEVSHNS